MFLRQLRVALGHLDIRVTKNLREFVEVAAVHHEPGRESVAPMPSAADSARSRLVFTLALRCAAGGLLMAKWLLSRWTTSIGKPAWSRYAGQESGLNRCLCLAQWEPPL